MEMKHQESSLVNKRGLLLYYQSWESGVKGYKKTANIIHGLGEHTGRYQELAAFLTFRDYKVFGLDLYGFGRSEGKRGHVKNIEDFISDEKLLFTLIQKNNRATSEKLLIGHSLGGLLALAYLEKYPDDYSHAVISSPALNPARNVSKTMLLLGKICRVIWPSLPFKNRIPPDQLCSDEEMQKAYQEDEYTHDTITPRLFDEMRSLGVRVWENADKINKDLRILFIHGEADEVTNYRDTHAFSTSVSVRDKKIKIIPNMKHHTLNDKEKAQTYQAMSEWFGY